MNEFPTLEARAFWHLHRAGFLLSEAQMRHPVEGTEYIGPDHETRERLKYGDLQPDDEATGNVVRAWARYCAELWCAKSSRKKYPSFASYVRSPGFRVYVGRLASEPGFKELLLAA